MTIDPKAIEAAKRLAKYIPERVDGMPGTILYGADVGLVARTLLQAETEIEIVKKAFFPGDSRKWYDLYQQGWASEKQAWAELTALRQIIREVVAAAKEEIREGEGDAAFQAGAQSVLNLLQDKTNQYMGESK